MTDKSFDSEDLSGEYIEDDIETKNQTDKEKGKDKNEEEKDNCQIMNLNLINSISNTLSTILEENKKMENYKEVIKKQNKMIFSANSIPNISIKDYLIRIQTYSGIEKSTLILSLILIDHTCKKAELVLNSEIAGVKLKELKQIEYSFLELNDFNVFVDDKEYEQYRKYLEEYNKISKEK